MEDNSNLGGCKASFNLVGSIVLVIVVSTTLEYILSVKGETLSTPVSRAIADSFTHFSVGLVSWQIVNPCNIGQTIFCAVFSSLIDIDHFLAAKSLSLKVATSLEFRPILHSILSIPVASIILWLITKLLHQVKAICCEAVISYICGLNLPLILVIAWSSHQLRDGLRRGLWVYNNIGTPPLPFSLYVTLLVAIPLALRLLLSYQYFNSQTEEYTLVPQEIELV